MSARVSVPQAGHCLSIRLTLSLLDLKHAFSLADEELVERWSENVVWQFFSGMEYYQPKLPCDATQIGRFRTTLNEAGAEEMLKACIDAVLAIKVVRPSEFERLIVDTTVQKKAIARPADSRLLEVARHHVVAPAIGYLRADHRINRCWLKGAHGDAIHAVLCAAGYSLRWLIDACS